jgi:hypothetical protein
MAINGLIRSRHQGQIHDSSLRINLSFFHSELMYNFCNIPSSKSSLLSLISKPSVQSPVCFFCNFVM